MALLLGGLAGSVPGPLATFVSGGVACASAALVTGVLVGLGGRRADKGFGRQPAQ